MVDLSGIEYNFLPGLLWWLVPVALVVVYLIWFIKDEPIMGVAHETILGAAIALGIVWLVIGWAFVLVIPSEGHVSREEKRMTLEQLESQGFANVELNSDRKFTASVDGQYFRGALVHDSEHRYQVVEFSVD